MAEKRPEGKFICKCECGGNVRGVKGFGRLWTWCDKCSPVVEFKVPKTADVKAKSMRKPRKCLRKGCSRPAKRGWTHCARHYTAGDSIKNVKLKKTDCTSNG